MGKDLWFSRKEYRNYVSECKYRLNEKYAEIFFPLQTEMYDIRAVKAIIALETGWLSDVKSYTFVVKNNNILGISRANDKPYFFSNINGCINFFSNLMKKPRYVQAYNLRSYGEEFLKELRKAGYNPSKEWEKACLQIYRSW